VEFRTPPLQFAGTNLGHHSYLLLYFVCGSPPNDDRPGMRGGLESYQR
jgi:hypothetical protein